MAKRIGAKKLDRNVKSLAAVSFFTDVSSEMIYPLLPLFLSTVLGTSAATLGLIEGVAESVSSLMRLPAGWWSDRVKRRKPLVLAGYGLSSLARPLIGLAQAGSQVLVIRVADRFGKGMRSAPRDALIADSVAPSERGYAFGLHRSADNLGAVVGPLVAWAILGLGWVDLRGLFLWAALPGAISVVLVVALVRERRAAPGASTAAEIATGVSRAMPPASAAAPVHAMAPSALGAPLRRYLVVLFIFTLGTSTDAFLLLRASQLGVPTALIPVLWAMLHVVKSGLAVVGGGLSDRLGRRPLILGGWAVYAAVYLGFAFASAAWHAWALFLVYGLYFGMTEGTEKAMVADLAPSTRRGAAFGWFNLVVGIGALPASILFGIVWDAAGPPAAFAMGAGIAATAAVLLSRLVPNTGSPAPERSTRTVHPNREQ